MKLFVQSLKDAEIKFEVLTYDPETKRGKIKSCRYGSVFEEDLSKEYLDKLGYKRIKEEDHAVE